MSCDMYVRYKQLFARGCFSCCLCVPSVCSRLFAPPPVVVVLAWVTVVPLSAFVGLAYSLSITFITARRFVDKCSSTSVVHTRNYCCCCCSIISRSLCFRHVPNDGIYRSSGRKETFSARYSIQYRYCLYPCWKQCHLPAHAVLPAFFTFGLLWCLLL